MEQKLIETIYQRYAPMMYRRCCGLLGDQQEAMDALQELFVKFTSMTSASLLDAGSSYFYTAATHHCLNIIRGKKRRSKIEECSALEEISVVADTSGMYEARSFLDYLFRRQKASSRVMAVLYYLDGFSLEEVAHTCGVSVSAVRKRLMKLKEDFKIVKMELDV
jgi:RNA polymerase sigma-70 factor, ECF subfamily